MCLRHLTSGNETCRSSRRLHLPSRQQQVHRCCHRRLVDYRVWDPSCAMRTGQAASSGKENMLPKPQQQTIRGKVTNDGLVMAIDSCNAAWCSVRFRNFFLSCDAKAAASSRAPDESFSPQTWRFSLLDVAMAAKLPQGG